MEPFRWVTTLFLLLVGRRTGALMAFLKSQLAMCWLLMRSITKVEAETPVSWSLPVELRPRRRMALIRRSTRCFRMECLVSILILLIRAASR